MKKGPTGLRIRVSDSPMLLQNPEKEPKPLEDSAIVQLEPHLFISSKAAQFIAILLWILFRLNGILETGYGGAKNLKEIEANGISHIFNCSPKNCPNLFESKPGIDYTNMEISDNPDQDLISFIGSFVKKADELIKQEKSILVHCHKVKYSPKHPII